MNTLTNIVKKYGEWLRFALLLIGMAATSYLNSHYITTDRYQADAAEGEKWRIETTKNIKELTSAVSMLAASVKVQTEQVNVRQEKMLDDHEQRIRALEKAVK